jgi:hypothetical protein
MLSFKDRGTPHAASVEQIGLEDLSGGCDSYRATATAGRVKWIHPNAFETNNRRHMFIA